MFAAATLYASFDHITIPVVWAISTLAMIYVVATACNVVDVLSGIPDHVQGKVTAKARQIRLDLIDPNPENPRDPASLTKDDFEFSKLLDSFLRHEWLPAFPLVVHDSGNGRYQLISGHRRKMAAEMCNISVAWCYVLSGMSKEEILKMTLDHGTVASLNDAEVLNAFISLSHAGFDLPQICVILGWKDKDKKPDRNKFKLFNNVSKLGPDERKTWCQYRTKGKDGLPYVPTGKVVEDLVKAIATDTKALHYGLPQDGEAYKAVIAKAEAEKNSPEESRIDSKLIAQMAGVQTGREWLRRLLARISNENTTDDLTIIMKVLMYMHDCVFGVAKGVTPMERPAVLGPDPALLRAAVLSQTGPTVPVADEPVADEPVADEPVADEPVADSLTFGETDAYLERFHSLLATALAAGTPLPDDVQIEADRIGSDPGLVTQAEWDSFLFGLEQWLARSEPATDDLAASMDYPKPIKRRVKK